MDNKDLLPNVGPDMDLETWITECSASGRLASILRDAGYGAAGELVHLENDAEILKDLEIEKAVKHQFAAAMKRWRLKSITATQPIRIKTEPSKDVANTTSANRDGALRASQRASA
ncbi:unnamed protein product [Tilletia laevis]|uniref:Uncharacterized protein n=3 Tax=Tilletia TaxID=13289 RepID=A0A8X7SRV2_9BASI|nr:hypothetical protein A4X06_0g9696 [Tilletia controversa]CAD6884702.1 unnamed protein product [Tilletia caries]CAD6929155.1 unnamed protein product [Tilletia laevis]CAD6933072.1 unnamed protein product [Tilletia caries]CAD6945459.1 unnamed protein product [Tilletia laevis]